MKNRLMALGLVGVVGFVACGEDERKPLITLNGSGSGGKLAKPGSGSGGEGADGEGGGNPTSGGKGSIVQPKGGSSALGGEDAGGMGGGGGEAVVGPPPTVTVLSPEEVTDPLVGGVLIGNSVNVVCRAVQSEEPDAPAVNPASVKVAILDEAGVLVSEKDAAYTGTADEYEGDVPLTLVETGRIGIRCSAHSLGNALGTDEIETFVDHGPKLTLTTPLDGAAAGLKDALKVQFEALPQPLVPSDVEADVASVELVVAGVPIATTPIDGTPNAYEATVDMNGTAFDPKPNGNTTLTLRATNQRAPTAVTATKDHLVVVDGVGPIITTGQDKALVGGTAQLTFTVTDVGSGVNPDSVVATLNTEVHEFDTNEGWSRTGDTFTYEFDSRNVTGSKVQITIKLQAEDNVKNAALEQTLVLYLDNVPPKIDLDPANVRTQQILTPFYCSSSFDPVGWQAANDEADGSGYDLFRAFVWEQTNFIDGSPAVRHYAGTNQSSVRLYFQSAAASVPLLVNSQTPGNGACNEIGDTSVPLELSPLAKAGAPWYTTGFDSGLIPNCPIYSPGSSQPIAALCGGVSDMSYVMNMADGGTTEPAVYVHAPTAGAECTGTAWEYRTFMDQNDTDGWVCFAVRAVDKIGNVGVSAPLRLCVDPDLDDLVQPDCMTMSTLPPACTDGCTPAPRGGDFVQGL